MPVIEIGVDMQRGRTLSRNSRFITAGAPVGVELPPLIERAALRCRILAIYLGRKERFTRQFRASVEKPNAPIASR